MKTFLILVAVFVMRESSYCLVSCFSGWLSRNYTSPPALFSSCIDTQFAVAGDSMMIDTRISPYSGAACIIWYAFVDQCFWQMVWHYTFSLWYILTVNFLIGVHILINLLVMFLGSFDHHDLILPSLLRWNRSVNELLRSRLSLILNLLRIVLVELKSGFFLPSMPELFLSHIHVT